jgi:NADH-quinone oxidoreductase subunit K
MSLELMFLSVNFNLITFGNYLGDLTGQVFVFFVLTVVAAESAIGLALLIVLFRSKKSIDVDDLSELKG